MWLNNLVIKNWKENHIHIERGKDRKRLVITS